MSTNTCQQVLTVFRNEKRFIQNYSMFSFVMSYGGKANLDKIYENLAVHLRVGNVKKFLEAYGAIQDSELWGLFETYLTEVFENLGIETYDDLVNLLNKPE